MDIAQLGWDPQAAGEIDHRQVKAPYVRLVTRTLGEHGDAVYFFDLRITQPNVSFLTPTGLHSLEHLLLAGFRKYLPANFINVAPMGCHTGMYLVLLNEGRASIVLEAYENILKDVLEETAVPYANIRDCGHWDDHDLELAKSVARRLLEHRADWHRVL